MAETLEGTTNVPGMGKVSKKAVAGGVLVVSTLVVVYYVRKNKSAGTTAAAAAATTTDQFPPDGTTGNPSDPYSTDPATGQTYGDEAAGAGTYGSFGLNNFGSSGIIGYDSAGNPVFAPGYNPQPSGTPAGGPPFPNNSAWSNWVIQQMVANNPNQDPGALTDALGLYLEGQPVDTSQQQLIFDAIAIAGNPPVAGANNYPPNVHLNGNTGGSGSTGGGSGGGSKGGGDNDGGSGGGTAHGSLPGLDGKTLSAAISTLQGAGYTLGTVSLGGKIVDPSQYGSHTVYSYTPHGSTVNIGLLD